MSNSTVAWQKSFVIPIKKFSKFVDLVQDLTFANGKFVIEDSFQDGDEIHSLVNMLGNDYPYMQNRLEKEVKDLIEAKQCKHEPSQCGQHGDFFAFLDVCEHCGVRLKAEKWVEA